MVGNRFFHYFTILLVAGVIIVDRLAWASVSQWHNDQAINIWLGYTRGLFDMPVGLISTQNFPNPNGMFIVGFFLSRLPDLWFVSTFLGCSQAGLIIWIARNNFGAFNRLFFVAAVPLLTSIILRPVSVEFWNQYFIAFINLLFLIWALRYLDRPSLWKIPSVVVLICIAPALYLAGVVNSLAMTLVGAAVIFYRPPSGWKSGWQKPFLMSLLVIACSVVVTWLPYFRSIRLSQLLELNPGGHLNYLQSLRVIGETVIGFPLYAPVQWAYVTFLNNSSEILSKPANWLVQATVWLGVAQGTLALAAVSIGLMTIWFKRSRPFLLSNFINPQAARLALLSAVFIIVSYSISPLLGGAIWAEGQRSDQVVQFLPLFMFVNFLSPFVFRLPVAAEKFLGRLAYSLLILYATVNILAGIFIIQSHLDYRGNMLTVADMDVPLVQKMQAVDFIATDWRSISKSDVIPVDYRLVGGIWGWIPEFGLQMQPWYPAPMTLGRSFDYDLLRRYGLRNLQEGVQFRKFGTGRYLVTYAFEPEPSLPGVLMSVHLFGRIRVNIVH
ncbi:MAG TPA: hypothetical protein VGK00_12890 [Anaerolineales bacterium]|jgi:hypothetical protein